MPFRPNELSNLFEREQIGRSSPMLGRIQDLGTARLVPQNGLAIHEWNRHPRLGSPVAKSRLRSTAFATKVCSSSIWPVWP